MPDAGCRMPDVGCPKYDGWMTNQHDPPGEVNQDVQVTMVGPRPIMDHRLLQVLNAWPDSTIDELHDLSDERRMVILRWPYRASDEVPF